MFGGLDLSLAVAAGDPSARRCRIRGDRRRRALFAGATLAGPGRVIRLRGGYAWRTEASAPRHSGLTICCARGIRVEPRRLSRESRRKGELMTRTMAPIAGAALALASSGAGAACIRGGAGCGVGHHGAGVGGRGVGVTHHGHATNRSGGRNRLGPRR
jgi:hypothetical protein